MSAERTPARPLWIVTADQLARGYYRRDPVTDAVSGPHELEDGTFEVQLPPDDAREVEP